MLRPRGRLRRRARARGVHRPEPHDARATEGTFTYTACFLARGGEDVTSERARTPSGSSSREEARRVSFPESRFHIEHPDPCLSPPRAHLAASRARGHRSVARRGRSRKRVRHPADALENAAWPARGGGGQAHGVPRVARRARGEVRHAVRGRDGRRRRGDDGPRVRRARRARRRHENENEK